MLTVDSRSSRRISNRCRCDDDKPKRLSLRERREMRAAGIDPDATPETSTISTPSTTATTTRTSGDSALKKYRESREVNEDEAIETNTKRRVVRLDENGNEEISVRDRNLVNTSKDDVKRDIERKTKNNESLAEEEEPKEADSNNNKKLTTEITVETEKTDEQRKRERAERRANRRREIEVSTNDTGKSPGTVTVETSIKSNGVTTATTRASRFSRKAEDTKENDNKKEEAKAGKKIDEIKSEEIKSEDVTKKEVKTEENVTVIKRTKARDEKVNETENKLDSTKVNEVKTSGIELKGSQFKKTVQEEKIESVEVKKVESAKCVEEETKDAITPLNKNKNNRFENKTTANKRPQSMGDFKSKFENKTSSTTNTTDNRFSKRPMSMNIKSKFEQGDTGAGKPVKFELKKTLSTPTGAKASLRSTTNKTDKNDKGVTEVVATLPSASAKTTSRNTTKTEKDDKGVHTEVVTTVTEATKGQGASKQEIKETKSVETKDTARQHAEKTTTVTETKTPAGKMTVKKTETKVETKPATTVLKKTGTSAAKSVEERMRERKQKEALAKKQQSTGRNAFKLKLEANAKKPVNLRLSNPTSPGGMMMAGLQSPPPKTPTSGDSNIDKLLKWIAKRINQYPAVHVTNFTSSWADGIALCALMNYLLGDEAINPLAVSSEDKKKNFELAIETGTKAGVPALIDAAEMAGASEVDRRSMITYLHTVYKVLWHDKQEKK